MRKNFWTVFISTFFYIGYAAYAPGTIASAAGVFLFMLLRSERVLLLSTAVILGLGFFVCGKAEKIFNKKDSSCIVIDEVAGMLLSLLFIPRNLKYVIIAFIVFRIIDIFKPYPLKKAQKLPGSTGVMTDDIIAGLYTNAFLRILALIYPP